MKVRIVILVALTLTACSIVVGQAQKSGQSKTFEGTVSDNMCGAKHMAKDKPAAECARECVKMGSDYALVVGSKVYTLKGDKSALDKFAGQKATVTGKESGETISVDSIAAPKTAK
jgi:hypothetical protein